MKDNIVEIIGWSGTTAVILAYLFVSFGVLPADSISYQLLNLYGGVALLILTFVKKVYQAVATNFFWSIIALIALLNILRIL